MLSQSEPRSNTPIDTEHFADELRAIAFLAAMQQYDVIRHLVGAVEEFANSGEGLKVGKVAMAARDAALKETGAGAAGLHLGVVVGF